MIYQSKWDFLSADKNTKSLKEKFLAKLTSRIIPTFSHSNKALDKTTTANIKNMLPPIPAKSQKEVIHISKFFKNIKLIKPVNITFTKSYAQVLKQSYMNNTSEVIKIKDTFSVLNTQKVDQIHKIVNGSLKPKLQIQMTTKGLSRKQIIILMSNDNIIKFMKNSLLHIANINRSLKNAKSEVLVDFICSDTACVTVITNKVTAQSDFYIIENYIKKVDDIDTINIEALRLPQSKSYLKVVGIPYYPHDSSNEHLTSNDVEGIIKQNQIFDNIVLASKLQVIKVSPKSDMSIIWIDIWDIQSGSKTKKSY